MTIKEAVIKYIEYRHSLGEKFKSAGILLVSFSKFIGDTTDISSINMESVIKSTGRSWRTDGA